MAKAGWVKSVEQVGEAIVSGLRDKTLRGKLRNSRSLFDGNTIGEPLPYSYAYTIRSGSKWNPFARKIAVVEGFSYDASEREGFYEAPWSQGVAVYDDSRLTEITEIVQGLNLQKGLKFIVKSAEQKRREDLELASTGRLF